MSSLGFLIASQAGSYRKASSLELETAAERNHNKSGNVCSPSPKVLEKAAYQDRKHFDQSSTNGKTGVIIIFAVSVGLKDELIFHLLRVGELQRSNFPTGMALAGPSAQPNWKRNGTRQQCSHSSDPVSVPR